MVPEMRQPEIFNISGHFLPFQPLENLENQNFNIEKKHLEISFYTFAPLLIIIWCIVPVMWSATDIIFCPSGLFFALFPLYWPRKSKFWKNEKKKPGDITILYKCTKNYDQMIYSSWDMVRNKQTDRRTEKVTYRGGCPT